MSICICKRNRIGKCAFDPAIPGNSCECGCHREKKCACPEKCGLKCLDIDCICTFHKINSQDSLPSTPAYHPMDFKPVDRFEEGRLQGREDAKRAVAQLYATHREGYPNLRQSLSVIDSLSDDKK